MRTRVLLTGARGQLGQALTKVLSQSVDLLPTARQADGSGMTVCDVSDWGQVTEVVGSFAPHVIVNAAAYTHVDGNEREPERARRINTQGVEHLLTAGKKAGAKIVQISTDYVFDGLAGPYLEGDETRPLSVYGRTKLEAERRVLDGNGHLVVRANVLFGPDMDAPSSFVGWVVHALKEEREISIVDDQVNNPTLTTHLAEAVGVAIKRGATGLFHYGGLEFATRFEFARKIAQHFSLDRQWMSPITTAKLNQAATRPLKSGLVCSKMKMELGVTNVTLKDALLQAFPLP